MRGGGRVRAAPEKARDETGREIGRWNVGVARRVESALDIDGGRSMVTNHRA
jgi:hypothetical protein